MIGAHVCGVGFWTPGFSQAASYLAGRRDPSVTEPRCTLVSPRHLRFTSTLTRTSVAVFEQAVEAQDLDLTRIDVILASSLGEIQIAVELLDMIALEGGASPARFMNSVHNTAPGHLSIATGSRGTFTAIAGGPQTVSAAFHEALCLLQAPDHGDVVVILADEALPPPLDVDRYPSMAMAFLLRREPVSSIATITGIRSDPSVEPFPVVEELAANPCSPGLGVLDAVLRGRAGPVRLDRSGDEGWCLDLEAP
jgi:beta-ketoacyl synthase-like protein